MEKMKFTFQRDVSYGFSWPPRNYSCSFCKKEYKSAQALGGHMNVHRRDRAKLMRELSPSNSDLNPSPEVTPNPNISWTPSSYGLNPKPELSSNPYFSSSSSTHGLNLMPHPNTSFSFPLSNGTNDGSNQNPNPNGSSSSKIKFVPLFSYGTRLIPFLGSDVDEGKSALKKEKEDGCHVLKKRKNLSSLDFDSGLIREVNNEDLDLELRLGSS